VFTVGATLNPAQFNEVALQVDYPKSLHPTAVLSCMTSMSDGKQQHLSCTAACVLCSVLFELSLPSRTTSCKCPCCWGRTVLCCVCLCAGPCPLLWVVASTCMQQGSVLAFVNIIN
jgi:hypothetical protein